MGPDPLLGSLEGYEAARVPAVRANKAYVCPSCGNAIGVGEGHVVAWPIDMIDDRRHWHHHCWRIVTRRGRIG